MSSDRTVFSYPVRTVTDAIQILVQGLTQGVVYALLAMGLALVYRTTKVINFAHGELMIFAVYVMYVLNQNPLRPVPYPLAALAGIGVAVGLGMLVYLVAIKRVTRFTGSIGWVLGTIAAAAVIQEGLVAIIGNSEPQAIPGPFAHLGVVRLGGVVIAQEYLVTAAIGLLIVIAFDFLESRTRLGRAMQAVAENPDAAALVGISRTRITYTAFALAAATAAVAGLLVTPITFAQPSKGAEFTVLALTAALLGGIDRVRAAALGGLLLGLFEIVLGRILNDAGSSLLSLRNVFVFSLLILVLVIRPRGVFGARVAERV